MTFSALPARLRDAWRHQQPYQKLLTATGLLLLASGAAHGIVFLVSGTPWEGPLSWRKPTLFGFSFGITAVTIALVASYLPLRRWLGWALLGSLAVFSLLETALITMQTWRGVPSHFNDTTAFDGAVFSAMGAAVAVIALVLVVLTVLCFTSLRAPAASLAWAIRAGMVLLVVGQALGALIIAVGVSQLVGDGDATAFGPSGVVFGEGGILKSPHGVALHAIQVLPLLAWLALLTSWPEGRRRRAVLGATAGYTLVLGVVGYQALTGRAPLALDVLSLLLLLGIGVVAIAAAYAAVAWHLLSRPARRPVALP